MHILSALVLLLLNVHFKTWRDLRETSGGILYVVLFNGLFYVLSKDMHPLPWVFNSKSMKPKALLYFHLILIMPLLILLFLSNRPRSLPQKISYVLKWTIGSSVVELIGHKLHAISFYHGWRIGWSTLLYLKMYTFCELILVKPWLTMVLSIGSTIFFLQKFNVPPIAIFKSTSNQ